VYSVYTGPIPNANPGIGDITFIVGFLLTGAIYYALNMGLRKPATESQPALGTRA
jgi:hypothetical protein